MRCQHWEVETKSHFTGKVFEPDRPAVREHIFKATKRVFTKPGVVFLAFLNGHQISFNHDCGQESTRVNLAPADIVRLANCCWPVTAS